jgi:hypothetical protein
MFWDKLAANPWELMPSMKNSQCHMFLQTFRLDYHKRKDDNCHDNDIKGKIVSKEK